MVTTIKQSSTQFKMLCDKCECIFEYSLEDLNPGPSEYVFCPCCFKRLFHDQREANVTEPERLIKSIPSIIEVSGTRLFLLKHERLAIAEAILAKNIVIEKGE